MTEKSELDGVWKKAKKKLSRLQANSTKLDAGAALAKCQRELFLMAAIFGS